MHFKSRASRGIFSFKQEEIIMKNISNALL